MCGLRPRNVPRHCTLSISISGNAIAATRISNIRAYCERAIARRYGGDPEAGSSRRGPNGLHCWRSGRRASRVRQATARGHHSVSERTDGYTRHDVARVVEPAVPEPRAASAELRLLVSAAPALEPAPMVELPPPVVRDPLHRPLLRLQRLLGVGASLHHVDCDGSPGPMPWARIGRRIPLCQAGVGVTARGCSA
jgi:hypothetical protein